jgi:hypothetical protein
VIVVVRAAALVAFAATALHAQGRYRVAIGIVGEAKPLVAEFRVCVPAETSDCGSWLVRNTSVDDAPVIRPHAATGPLRASTIADSISIEGDDIAIKSLVAGTKPARNVLREKDHTPRAIALTPDSRYVFVVFDDATGESGLIDLIELESMAVIDTLRVRGRPAGIAILR